MSDVTMADVEEARDASAIGGWLEGAWLKDGWLISGLGYVDSSDLPVDHLAAVVEYAFEIASSCPKSQRQRAILKLMLADEAVPPQAVKSSDADVLKRVQSWANCRDNEAYDRYALGCIRELIRPLTKRASNDNSEYGDLLRLLDTVARDYDTYASVVYHLGRIAIMAEQALSMIGGDS